MRQVTHALLTRPPLETDQICRSFNEKFPVRLACVKHAASVHPEPGSNSLNKCAHQDFHVLALMKIVRSSSRTCSARFAPGQNQLLANLSLLLFLRIFRSFVFMILKRTFEECVSLFSYQRSFCIAVCLKQLCYYIMLLPACQEVFSTFFEVIFNFSTHQRQLRYLITTHFILSRTFFISFFNRVCQLQL